jgi:predicted negative regulator of RcsB-dependent stress response
MAQASRSSISTGPLSDDPVENISLWFQQNLKVVLIGGAVVLVAVAAVFGYRSMDESKRIDANNELYKATGPMLQGNLPDAQIALDRVAKRFAGTSSGTQASLLLAQVLYDQKKFAEGIKALEAASGAAGPDFGASVQALIAAGYESQGKFVEAASHFETASSLAKFPVDKGANRASQARSLTEAGKFAEARKIWEELAKDESLPFAQEAQVRIGELSAAGR